MHITMLRALCALCLLWCIVLSEGRPRRHFSKQGKWRQAFKGAKEAHVDLVDRIVNGTDAGRNSHPYLVSIFMVLSEPDTEQPCSSNNGDYDYYDNDYGEDNGDGYEDNDGNGYYGDYDDWSDDSEGSWKRSRLAARVPRPLEEGSNRPGSVVRPVVEQGGQLGHAPRPGQQAHKPGNQLRPWVEPGNGNRPWITEGNKPAKETENETEHPMRPWFMQARGNARRVKQRRSRHHVKSDSTQSFHICGGTLIHPEWVLTAAHCVIDNMQVQVKIGEYNMSNHLEPNEEAISVTKSIRHPNYNETTMANDIALLKLNKSVDITNNEIKAILLPTHAVQTGEMCTIAGWGNIHAVDETDDSMRRTYTSKNVRQQAEFPIILQEAEVQIQSQDECNTTYSQYYGGNAIQETMVCASDPKNGIDSCQGDSGGPMICQEGSDKAVCGIVSWGKGCAQKEYPGVYTRVYSYVDWINSHTMVDA